jgi:hypothetical protein
MIGFIISMFFLNFNIVDKIGVGGGIVYLEPEGVWGKEFNCCFVSQEFTKKLSGEICVDYWNTTRKLTIRELNWENINLEIGIRWYPIKILYLSSKLNFYQLYMEDNHLQTEYIDKLEEKGISMSFINIGLDIPIKYKFQVELETGLKYLFQLYYTKDEILNHMEPGYSIKLNVEYQLTGKKNK